MTQGIHHITAIASNAQENYRFYSKLLGLRLVKKTVNQDDTETYHLFYGDKEGQPGMDLTFFLFQPAMQGEAGNGQVTTISLAIPETALEFWQERFAQHAVQSHEPTNRFGRPRLRFTDHDHQALELVGVPESQLPAADGVWTTDEVKTENAIRSFHAATLSTPSLGLLTPILTDVFGYELQAEEGNHHLFAVGHSNRAQFLEVEEASDKEFGFNAAGTVHHIAFRARDQDHQQQLRERVVELGLQATGVIDRFYFQSVYFRTPAGILFEIATDGPGFTADEPAATLGQELALPPFLEPQRSEIESHLPPLSLGEVL